MTKSFYIGNVEFHITSPVPVSFSEDIGKFTIVQFPINRKVIYHIVFQETPSPVPMRLLTTVDYPPQIIGNTANGECRIYQDIFTGKPVACYQEIDRDNVTLTFYKKRPDEIVLDLNLLNYMAIERQLLFAGNMVLHSSFINVNGEAILFTAPSGTGKSTQADLWKKFRGAQVVNGDRSLLVKQDGKWFTAGFPFSGSSGINENVVCPIKAIIMIHQAPLDQARFATMMTAFKRIYPEITRNYWNTEYENRVLEILEDLVGNVTTVELGCTIAESAVECLENILNMGE